jgi:hypothetical protein
MRDLTQQFESGRDEHGTSEASCRHALSRLMSLHEGDQGVVDAVACGPEILPALRRLLFSREPSGLYQPRCHVVEAIALLGGHDILIAFLESPREIADPVEAAGEDAVMNAAARALRDVQDEHVFQLMLSLAESRCLSGPVEVLGRWRRPESLPCLVEALADDLARPIAEEAIRHFGADAIPALLQAVGNPRRVTGAETESSRLRRRAALTLLLDLSAPVPRDVMANLIRDDDAGLSVLGCRFALTYGSEDECRAAAGRLIDWLLRSPQFLRPDIEECLMVHFDIAGPIIEERLHSLGTPEDAFSREAEIFRLLTRVVLLATARQEAGRRHSGPPA